MAIAAPSERSDHALWNASQRWKNHMSERTRVNRCARKFTLFLLPLRYRALFLWPLFLPVVAYFWNEDRAVLYILVPWPRLIVS